MIDSLERIASALEAIAEHVAGETSFDAVITKCESLDALDKNGNVAYAVLALEFLTDCHRIVRTELYFGHPDRSQNSRSIKLRSEFATALRIEQIPDHTLLVGKKIVLRERGHRLTGFDCHSSIRVAEFLVEQVHGRRQL
jgi:hypothetical protein